MINWLVYCDQKRICHIQGCQSKKNIQQFYVVTHSIKNMNSIKMSAFAILSKMYMMVSTTNATQMIFGREEEIVSDASSFNWHYHFSDYALSRN